MGTSNSKRIMKKALGLMPGGVNSPVRALKAVGGNPLFIKKAKGSKIYDVDGNSYIDYIGSWGPMILGHAHPKVTSALKKALERGTSYGAPTELEVELASMVVEAFSSIEMVRFVNSGTEATMSAIRLARAYTKRDKLIKFEGGYHGHSDGLLVKAGSGAATFGIPDSPGVPAGTAANTYTAVYNDLDSVRAIFEADPEGVACVIIEGVPGNMGVVPPKEGFLEGLSEILDRFGALLIMDEVMSGFRLCYGGAQDVYGIRPDLTTLGKVIGGGMPVGAFGGGRGIMQKKAPPRPVYQAGTLSGNPVAVAAGLATLKLVQAPGFYDRLSGATRALTDGLARTAQKRGVAFSSQSVGGMFGIYFRAQPPASYVQVLQ